MSRLIVKNLPKNVTKETVLETFSKKGVVTDVQLKYMKDGTFRGFGFVGFKSSEDAASALQYFDNTFINAARIRVELCAELGDANKPKAWCEFNKDVREKIKNRAALQKNDSSKEREPLKKGLSNKESSTKVGQKKDGEKSQINPVVKELLAKHKEDPLFREFMEAHAGGDKNIWDNDVAEIVATETEKKREKKKKKSVQNDMAESLEDEVPEEQKKIAEEKISDLEYLRRLTIKDVKETEEKNEIEEKISYTESGMKKKKKKKKGEKVVDDVDETGADLTQIPPDAESSKEESGMKKKKKKKKGEKVVDEVGEMGVDLTQIPPDAESSEEKDATVTKPPRIKMPKQKKEFKEFLTVKIAGLPRNTKKKSIKEFFQPLKLASVRFLPLMKGIAFVGVDTEKDLKHLLSKHRSFLGGKRITVTVHVKKKPQDTKNINSSKWQAQEESLKDEEPISESGRIFLRNLSYTTTEEDLEVLFHQFGDTTEVSMPVDRNTRLSKGFAHVTFLFPEHAVKAFSSLDGTVFNGRMLHLLPGKSKVSLEEAMEQDGLSYSAKKALKQKSQSGSSHNWNSLFLGQNAVADVMASSYNTTKEQVLDARGSESLAVRLALGETQIVTQTREFLTKNGVRLDAFNQAPKQRSKRVVLVKNLPAQTTEKEIADLFAPQGELQRVILPPNGVTAIIEFVEPSEARTAFTRLAYTKFKDLPLYLEWAPLDTFHDSSNKEVPNTAVGTTTEGDKSIKRDGHEGSLDNSEHPIQSEEPLPPEEPEDQNEPPEPDTTLYVKNINFKTTEDELREHFKKCGTIHSLTIAYKRSATSLSESLSMGYGFVRFKKSASALTALKTLHNVPLQGHNLEITPSHRTVATDVVSARKKTAVGKQNGSKILVRNIPFQANYHEIKDLFKTFGELKAIRLPKKMTGTGTHRGFVFVEYESKSDAKRAFEALSQSTHLYGRRLVLEWAAKDDDVDDLRKRTADQFFSGPSKEKVMRSSTMNIDEAQMEEYE